MGFAEDSRVTRLVAVCTASCILLFACAHAARTPPGFYRGASELTVYKLDADGTYCMVVSMEMMNAYGGLAQVHVMNGGMASFTTGYRSLDPPSCGWPAGYYRTAGAIFEVSSDTVCLVRSGREMRDVISVEGGANLALHKIFTGDCARR